MTASRRPAAIGVRHRDRDRGSGTVLVLALVGFLVAFTGFVAAVGAAVVARHRAEAAADLAALAAASGVALWAASGVGLSAAANPAACARAAAVARAGGATVTRCDVLDDSSVLVEVVVVVSVPALGRRLPARARARAGHPAAA